MKRSDSSKKIKEVRRLYSSKGIKSLPYQKGLDSDSCSFGRLQSVHRSNRSKSCNLEAGTNGLLGRWAKISFGAATCRKINTVGEEISFGRLSTYVGEEISISCLRGKELPLFHAALGYIYIYIRKVHVVTRSVVHHSAASTKECKRAHSALASSACC